MPTIVDRQGPLFQRIVTALSEDISAGRLRQGQMLPTHRALAQALGVDVTTVTRAYAEARRIGLTEARVGRGTFVRASGARQGRSVPAPGIDLSMNLPPQPPGADFDYRVSETFGALRSEQGLGAYLTYQRPGGTATERQIAAGWLAPVLRDLSADRVVIAPGTQPVLYCLLMGLAKPGGSVLVERLAYPGLKAAAALAGVTLVGVDMDGEGMIPAALDKAARAHGAATVYLVPTVHNPTTATMSAERRARIAAVIRKRGLTLIEDDPHLFLVPGTRPLAALVPERTYLTMSLSKCLAPGLRTALVVVPDRAAGRRLANGLRAVLQMSPPLTTAIALRWMESGAADAIVTAVRAEAAARQDLCAAALDGVAYARHPSGHHIWLPLPPGVSSERFALQLERRGLAVVTGEAFATDGRPPNAIRIALGAARNRAQLTKALDIVADALEGRGLDEHVV